MWKHYVYYDCTDLNTKKVYITITVTT
uniref:Uncharacterized protein n=1 Tax=Anguilla anguilla TaxID=7936 RepID=A0A0E9PL40_ANGAN